jgi:3-deoxy-D-manno-octulosonic acid (KDO) 8-phosphate synthase
MAERMRAATVRIDSGHLSLITHPQEVAQLIMDAVHSVQQRGAAGGTSQPM